MLDTITCANCSATFTDESLSTEPEQRKRCPKCGSIARVFSESVEMKITVSVAAEAEVITYPQALLSVAKGLMDGGQYSIAVVVSHMACEIATERALTESFSNKEILYLKDAVTSLLNGYNITSGNGRILKLYTALTGDDEIQKQTFWQKLAESAKLRNKIIHAGRTVGKMEAKASHQAASAFVVYLNK